jgi:hypothetical protein
MKRPDLHIPTTDIECKVFIQMPSVTEEINISPVISPCGVRAIENRLQRVGRHLVVHALGFQAYSSVEISLKFRAVAGGGSRGKMPTGITTGIRVFHANFCLKIPKSGVLPPMTKILATGLKLLWCIGHVGNASIFFYLYFFFKGQGPLGSKGAPPGVRRA